ncbi:hypothetical protein N8T08_000296 [Aspergillus melleus]|uniref:Uncharacterized protein n=1 Tax=Aspergillus melleus TaxID=138277 RepID=A0ACC3BBG6_9EURO|nr:hypothetical protein N8T08_000296 [Aspergillus melleus]
MAIIHEIGLDGMDAVGRRFLDLVDPVRATVTDNEDIAGYLHRGQDLHIPSYLDGQLDDYMLALDAAPMDPVLIASRVVTIPTPVDGEIHYLRGIADGILWCGSERELEANLVIQKTDGVADGQGARLPPVMLMLHYSRRISERHSEIYGIVTNSYKWRFLRIDNDSR